MDKGFSQNHLWVSWVWWPVEVIILCRLQVELLDQTIKSVVAPLQATSFAHLHFPICHSPCREQWSGPGLCFDPWSGPGPCLEPWSCPGPCYDPWSSPGPSFWALIQSQSLFLAVSSHPAQDKEFTEDEWMNKWWVMSSVLHLNTLW